MADPWILLAIVAGAVAAAGLHLLTRRLTVTFANPRDERLTRQVAQTVGCTLAQALPAVPREIDIAPEQSDETLVKRAVYHYRHELPEQQCFGYRSRHEAEVDPHVPGRGPFDVAYVGSALCLLKPGET